MVNIIVNGACQFNRATVLLATTCATFKLLQNMHNFMVSYIKGDYAYFECDAKKHIVTYEQIEIRSAYRGFGVDKLFVFNLLGFFWQL